MRRQREELAQREWQLADPIEVLLRLLVQVLLLLPRVLRMRIIMPFDEHKRLALERATDEELFNLVLVALALRRLALRLWLRRRGLLGQRPGGGSRSTSLAPLISCLPRGLAANPLLD